MIKIFSVILLIFNILACNPIQQASNRGDIQLQPSFSCLTSQNNCVVNSKFGRFSIQFSGETPHKRIKTELPFQIQLEFEASDKTFQLKSISSYLEGKTMFMGKIPVLFHNNETNSMVAESLLASCSEEVMTWRLWFQIEIIADGEIQQQDFFIDFDSERL